MNLEKLADDIVNDLFNAAPDGSGYVLPLLVIDGRIYDPDDISDLHANFNNRYNIGWNTPDHTIIFQTCINYQKAQSILRLEPRYLCKHLIALVWPVVDGYELIRDYHADKQAVTTMLNDLPPRPPVPVNRRIKTGLSDAENDEWWRLYFAWLNYVVENWPTINEQFQEVREQLQRSLERQKNGEPLSWQGEIHDLTRSLAVADALAGLVDAVTRQAPADEISVILDKLVAELADRWKTHRWQRITDFNNRVEWPVMRVMLDTH